MMKVSFGIPHPGIPFRNHLHMDTKSTNPQKTHSRISTCPRIKGTTLLALHGGCETPGGRMEFPRNVRPSWLMKLMASYVPWSRLSRFVGDGHNPIFNTVDGLNPANQLRLVVEIPLFIGFHTSQVVQDFSHQQ